MTLLRRILREPVFSGHLEGSRGCPLLLYRFDCTVFHFIGSFNTFMLIFVSRLYIFLFRCHAQ